MNTQISVICILNLYLLLKNSQLIFNKTQTNIPTQYQITNL